MKTWRTASCVALVVVSFGSVGAPSASAQDTLARAKDFYASASYEEALQVIERIRPDSPSGPASEVAAYQVFCLVALGRTDQAKHAIEALVRLDPMYRPSEAEASPRVRTLFEETRRPLVPQLARLSYAKAKSAFDRKDFPEASTEFARAIALLDELADADDPGTADLRTLAIGFRDLSKTSTAPAPPPPAPAPVKPPAPEPPPTVATAVETAPPAVPKAASSMPDRNFVYGAENTDVRAPIAVSRNLPQWSPANTFESKQILAGVLELIVAEDGSVSSTLMRKSVLPSYDAALLKAAAGWKFKPATKNGVAVKYRLDVSVQLGKEP